MTPRQLERVQSCSLRDATKRQSHAWKFLEAAELVATEQLDNPESASVAASMTVLAGIAASDAACCAAQRKRSRSPDHHAAEKLLHKIAPNGPAAAKQLRHLLDLKDQAQYGFIDVSDKDLRAVLRQARAIIKFAEEVIERNSKGSRSSSTETDVL